MTKDEKQKKFADWYQNLPACLQSKIRESVIDAAEITKSTFYNYLTGRTEIPNFTWNKCIVKFVDGLDQALKQ